MLKPHAAADLIRHYAQAFRQAWSRRAEFDYAPPHSHETQFLPAALALQETPVSPAPRMAMWLLMAFASMALLWAVFGCIDEVATAHGKIVPNDRIKTIQPVETAVVKAIHVTEGQAVKEGDPLIDLDATIAQADLERVASDLATSRLQVARARAMLTAVNTGDRPGFAIWPGLDHAKYQEALSLLQGQYLEYTARQARIMAEVTKRAAELRSTQELVNKLMQTAPIARQRAQDYKDLADKNFVSRHGYLEREQQRIEQEGELAAQRSRLNEIEAALQEAKAQRAELAAEVRRVNLDSVNEGLQKSAALEQELKKAESRGRLMRLTAPVAGTVQQLALHTVGGVVTPAQPVMVIVPSDQPIEIEAFIENKDIGFVRPGQKAEVKIETFQYTKYGTIPAVVTFVSHDAISDEKRGLIYSARVKMSRSRINVDGADVNLSPGMAVAVEVKTGKRRVIEYFLSPLMQYSSESLRER
jgi:hemolysin D